MVATDMFESQGGNEWDISLFFSNDDINKNFFLAILGPF